MRNAASASTYKSLRVYETRPRNNIRISSKELKMIHSFRTASIGVAVAAIFSAMPVTAETLRLAGNFPVEHSSSVAMERFAEGVASRTDGALTVETFPAMQLGGAKE